MNKSELRHLIKEELQSTQLADLFDQAIVQVDENLSYSEFAKAVAQVLQDSYGSHNYESFMKVLHKELGIK